MKIVRYLCWKILDRLIYTLFIIWILSEGVLILFLEKKKAFKFCVE